MTHFNMVESCGKCTPCREGTVRLLEVFARIGAPQQADRSDDIRQLRELSQVVGPASLCGLGQMAPNPVLSALEHFESEFRGRESETDHRPAGAGER